MKLGYVCRADQMEFNSPTLRSPTKFYAELEQPWFSPTATLACILAYGFSKKPRGSKVIVIHLQLANGSQSSFKCVDPPFAQKLYREQYFRTSTLVATRLE